MGKSSYVKYFMIKIDHISMETDFLTSFSTYRNFLHEYFHIAQRLHPNIPRYLEEKLLTLNSKMPSSLFNFSQMEFTRP